MKDITIRFRATKEDKIMLDNICKTQGLTLSQLIRQQILGNNTLAAIGTRLKKSSKGNLPKLHNKLIVEATSKPSFKPYFKDKDKDLLNKYYS